MRDSGLAPWRRGPAGEFCREAFRAGGDPGRLCRPEPDRRARAGARRIAGDVDEILPYARKDGLARNAGQPDAATSAMAGGLALVIALLSLSWTNALYAALAAGVSGLGMARLAMRQIGGQTGDVLGGAEQVSETAILVLLAARLAQP